MPSLKRILYVIPLVLWLSAIVASDGFAQTRIDSLKRELNNVGKSDRIDLLYQLSYSIYEQLNMEESDEVFNNLLEDLNSYSTEALELSNKNGSVLQKAKALRVRGLYCYYSKLDDELFDLHTQSLELYKQTEDFDAYLEAIYDLGELHSAIDISKGIATYSRIYDVNIHSIKYPENHFSILYRLGLNYFQIGDYEKSGEIFISLQKASTELSDTLWLGRSYGALGSAAYTGGDYNKALEYYMESLKINEQLGEKSFIATSMVNIGNVHKAIKSWNTAKDYYLNALKIYEELGEKSRMASCLNNIGIIYEEDKKYDEAEAYYNESLKLREELKDSVAVMFNYVNLGSLYGKNKEYSKALTSYRKALVIAQRRADKNRIALISNNIGEVYSNQTNYQEALGYYNRSLNISKELGLRDIIALNYRGMSKSYEMMGDKDKALKYFKDFFEVRDSILNEGNQKAIAEMQTKYDTEKKEQQLVLANKDNELKDAAIKRDRLVKISMGIGIVFVIIFAVFVVIQLQEKKKKNILLAQQNDEIQKQKNEIESQRDLLSKQKQEITDSIRYARRIQKAILPPENIPMDIMPEHFVLFRPRDIVSGDYYWIAKHGGKTFIVAADCTGHGVPGAFMSMLGVAFLNEIVLFQNNLEPDIILNELRRLVKTTLGQTGKADEAKDGMDISLCAINWETQTIQWAGAYNPLFYFRDGEFNEIKADKMPIGIYIKDTLSFTKHEFQFQKGDTFYIFSDGYVDQFGGEDGRKFMTKSFKALLAEIQPQPLSEQIQVLEKAHLDWRGEHEQVDDICVIGFRM